MDSPLLPSEPPPPRERRRIQPERSRTVALRALGGFAAYVAVLFLCAAGGGGPGPALLFALITFAIVTAVKRTARGFALGVFIGLGLTLLGVGVCFVMVANMKF